MVPSINNKKTAPGSFIQVYRLIFVIFSLYLLSDAFSRWDGFSYYGSLNEFLPGVALATILWTLTAFFVALALWMVLRVFIRVCDQIGWKVSLDQLLFFVTLSIFLGAMVWAGKRLLWETLETSRLLKLAVLIVVVFISAVLTGLFRKKTGIINERITPLVWLFSAWLLISFPVVIYTAGLKQNGNNIQHASVQPVRSDINRPNILLVVFDTTTAEDMSVYGYHRETTPFLGKWAEKASLFSRLEAEDNYTTPTTASLMTGKRVWTHQTFQIKGSKPVKSSIESLPLLLKKNGYYNMALIANPAASVKMLGIDNSFDLAPSPVEFSAPVSLFGWGFGVIDGLLYKLFGDKIALYDWVVKQDFILDKFLDAISRNISLTTVPPGNIFNRFFDVIDTRSFDAPFFAWLHIFPPHYPYLPPEPYMGSFDSSSAFKTYKSQKVTIFGLNRYSEYDQFPPDVQEEVNILRSRYDEFMKYSDNQFEIFINEFEKRDISKNTVVIFTSDHGESFQHAYIEHGGLQLYEDVTHIPLIIKEPGQMEGRVINDLVEQIDITATILDIAGITPPEWVEGRSLVPLMNGEKIQSKPAFSMALESNLSRGHKITSGTITVWEDQWKLIHYLDQNKSLLYNLKEDRYELNNLTDKEPNIAGHLLDLIMNNLEKANKKIEG